MKLLASYLRALGPVALLICAAWTGNLALAGDVIDNAKLEKMCKEGVSLDVILKLLEPAAGPGEARKGANCRFDASTDAMISLQKAGKEGGWQAEDIKKLQTKVIELANKDQKILKELVDRALNVFENADEQEYAAMMRELTKEEKRVIPYLLDKENVESERQRSGIADVLGRMNDKSENVVGAVTNMLGDRAKPVRLKAAQAIVNLAGPGTAEQLIARLSSRIEKVDGVAMALGYLGEQRAIEPLTKVLKLSGDSDARICAAFSLGELRAKAPEATEALLNAVLDDRDEKLRESAAAALSKIGEKRTPSYIVSAFHRFRPGREELLRHLASFKDLDGLHFLVGLVGSDSDDPKVKKAAVETLRILTGENGTDAEDWQGIAKVLEVRPDWARGAQNATKIPEAGRERDVNQARDKDMDEGIPTKAR
ncbi:MAG: HEAT repeat domain-containing protein [Planctomycetota bacterium]